MATKKQHYIPRMILKHFVLFQVPMTKPMICQYDKEKRIERLVDIANVCKKNNLYEIRNASNVIQDNERNVIEKLLSLLESNADKIIRKIEHCENLGDEEQTWMIIFITFQLLRTPETIDFICKWVQQVQNDAGKPLDANLIERYVKVETFLCGQKDPAENLTFYPMLKNIASGKHLIIYRTRSELLLNGSRPVLCFAASSIPSTSVYFFPITPHLCLSLTSKAMPLYASLDDNITSVLNHNIFFNKGRFIYSNKCGLAKQYDADY